MNTDSTTIPRPLPRGLAFLVGSAIAAHLAAILLLVIAAPSGPWPTAFGNDLAVGPPFAQSTAETVTRRYLTPLKMTHNYHFARNRPGQPGVYFEVILADQDGKTQQTLRFPDPQANFWVRQRQTALAQELANDVPVQPRAGEAIPAPNQQVRTIDIWDIKDDGTLFLRTIPEHLVPRDRMVYRPSMWSRLLARSYMRHLCRVHGAASARLIRHTREAILPAMLLHSDPPADLFSELISDFGEVKQ